MKPTALRDSLIYQAETSFVELTTELNHLFDLVSFYLERYPPDGSPGHRLKDVELKRTVDNLAHLVAQLAEVIACWKAGADRLLSLDATELNLLNEIAANARALIYFLSSHDIDLEPFDLSRAATAHVALRQCNRLLT